MNGCSRASGTDGSGPERARPPPAAALQSLRHTPGRVPGPPLRPNRRLTDPTAASRRPTAHEPGTIRPDDDPDTDVMEQQARRALQQAPRKAADLAVRHISACGGCS